MRNFKQREYFEDNSKRRFKFRLIGVILTLIGSVMFVIGLIDLITLDSFEEPEFAWMLFIGILVLFPGLVCLSMGYMGKVARYQAGEISPIAKDATNYILEGTREEFSKNFKRINGNLCLCPNCNQSIDKDSTFCNHCGKKLRKDCSKCSTINDSDSKYCKKCGNELRR